MHGEALDVELRTGEETAVQATSQTGTMLAGLIRPVAEAIKLTTWLADIHSI